MRKIPVRKDIIIDEVLQNAEYLGDGASKMAYLINGKVIKVPKGIDTDVEHVNVPNYILDTNAETDYLVYIIDEEYDASLVWSLGQFAVEVFVWEKLKILEAEGWDISGFARILDYYEDANGVFVIEQQPLLGEGSHGDDFTTYCDSIKAIREELKKRWGIDLRDIDLRNCGYRDDGMLACYDYGLSSDSLYNYDDYDNYCEGDWDDDEDDDCEDEDCEGDGICW